MIKLLNKAMLSLLLLGMAFTAQAAPDLTVGSVSGAAGDTVTIPITFATEGTVTGAQFTITYDTTLLSSVGIATTAPATNASGSALSGSLSTAAIEPAPGTINFVIVDALFGTLIPDGEVATLDFTIDGAAPAGAIPLTLSNVQYADAAAGEVVPDASTDGAVTVTVTAGALPSVSIAGTTPAAEPATNGLFTVSRTGSTAAALTVQLSTATGSATSGTDYTALPTSVVIPVGAADVTVDLTVTDDADVEGTETVILAIAADAAYAIGTASATLDIADDEVAPVDPVVSITATDANAEETSAGPTLDNGQFTIACTGGTGAAVDVVLGVSGSATAGTDYTAITSPVSVTCPGSTTVDVTVLVDGDDAESSETVSVSLTAGAGYDLGASSANVVITGDVTGPRVIPTLGAWALILMALSLMFIAVPMVRTRQS